jgi:hypothetical protein
MLPVLRRANLQSLARNARSLMLSHCTHNLCSTVTAAGVQFSLRLASRVRISRVLDGMVVGHATGLLTCPDAVRRLSA